MGLEKPILFINFKTYLQATGANAVALARKAEQAAEAANTVVLVVQAVDIRAVAAAVKLPVFAQHIDPVEPGSNTGHVLVQAIKEAGAIGTVLNHAENKRDNEFLEAAIGKAKEAGLFVMVCAEDIERAKQIAGFSTKPDFIAVEPPELIGGDVSVSSVQPELITESVKAIKEVAAEIDVVTGAGIKNSDDVRKAVELGTVGVFVASGIVKAEDCGKAISDLLDGFS